ncbi:MAG: DUF222 domain-containing protein [Acidimicrobiales bacterium]
MAATVTAAGNLLRRALGALEPRTFGGDDAARLLRLFAEAERLAGAGKALMARRVEETNTWRRDGHRSAASWLAAATGSSVGVAVGTLETARRLEDLPAVAEAHRAGQLSQIQAREITGAADADPTAEADLLSAAKREPVAALRAGQGVGGGWRRGGPSPPTAPQPPLAPLERRRRSVSHGSAHHP